MLIDWLLELKNNINEHGIRWGVAFTIYALLRKERRNFKLDKRDDAVFHNQKVIMEHLGLGDQFIGQVSASEEDLRNFRKLYDSSRKGIQSVSQLRRESKMNQQVNWMTLVPAVFGVMKLTLQPFGIDLSSITDEQINTIVNGVAAVFAIVGVFATHRKKGDAENGSVTKYTGDGPAV